MRAYVITGLERKIIRRFLENGEQLDGFRTLKMRIKRHHKRVLEDSEFIKKFIETLGDISE